jgi:hypothetical protein
MVLSLVSRNKNTPNTMSQIESHLASLSTVRYEKEDGLREYQVVRFEGVKLSKKSGKEYATFIVKAGEKEETRNLFLDQIQ